MRKRVFVGVCFILILFVVLSPSDVEAQSNTFPEGLVLHYEQALSSDGIITSRRLFIYEVIGWFPSAGDDVIKINKSIDLYENETHYVKIPSWDIVDENGISTGSYMTTPLWVDLHGWEDEGSIELPVESEHASTYETTSEEIIEVPYNNFTCWKAYYTKYNIGSTIQKTIFYENTFGVKIMEEGKMALTGGVYVLTGTTYELNYTNLDEFRGSLSFGLSLEVILIGAGAGFLLVIVVVIIRRR